MAANSPEGDKGIVRYVRLASLTVYEVSEDELTNLEQGSPVPRLLSFSLFLIGVAVTAMITLLSVPIPSTKVFCTFMILMVVGYVAGGILLLTSFTYMRRTKSVGTTIRERAAASFAEGKQIVETEVVQEAQS